MSKILNFVKTGIIFGKDIERLFSLAKKHQFAIPAINCVSIDSINAVLESANNCRSPIIIQFSHGGSSFLSGLGIKNSTNIHKRSVIGAIIGAKYVHSIAKYYKIPIILHTDHCNKTNLPWIDNLLMESKLFYKKNKQPLFSSHMIDLSQEDLKENVKICVKYFKEMVKLNIFLEIELGCTGGEEDGIDNTKIDSSLLYTQSKDVYYAYKHLKKIGSFFTIAASFGNVHGVYKIGNVKLRPSILKKSQKYIIKKCCLKEKTPINFVFHGGSGSSVHELKCSISYGTVKVNVDTDIQWALWKGVLDYYTSKKDFLKSQLGNPNGKNNPNKKFYDPRIWIRSSQTSAILELKKIFKKLNSYNVL